MMDSIANNTVTSMASTMFTNKFFTYLKPNDAFDVYSKKNYENKMCEVRLIGPILAYHYHTCEYIQKDTGIKKSYNMPCLSYNQQTGEAIEDADCPYCKAGVPSQIKYYVNAIIRDLEETEHAPYERLESEKKPVKINGSAFFLRAYTQGVDSKGNQIIKYSKSISPVRVLGLPKSVCKRIADMERSNLVKGADGQKRLAPLSDLEFGCDITIEYRPDEPPSTKYAVDRSAEGRTPITKEMRKNDLLLYDLTILPDIDAEALKKDFIRNCHRIINITNKDYVNSLVGTQQPAVKTVNVSQISVQSVAPKNVKPQVSASASVDDLDDEFSDLD